MVPSLKVSSNRMIMNSLLPVISPGERRERSCDKAKISAVMGFQDRTFLFIYILLNTHNLV